jgi:hypothetical protein
MLAIGKGKTANAENLEPILFFTLPLAVTEFANANC